LEGLVVEPVHVETGISKFDLSLVLTDTGSGGEIWLEVEYQTALFDLVRIERMADDFRRLLGISRPTLTCRSHGCGARTRGKGKKGGKGSNLSRVEISAATRMKFPDCFRE
jgi:hypothetical protein